MNMKTNTHRRGLHRIVAFLLCAVCVFSLLPAQAFAAGVGQKASSWLGDQYVGSDGQHYYSPVPTNSCSPGSPSSRLKAICGTRSFTRKDRPAIIICWTAG